MYLNKLTLGLSLLVCACGIGCATQSGSQEAAPAAAEQPAITQPDREAFVSHAQDHIEYPASRADVMAACANTDEFTEAEKAWVGEHLPEGTYASADEVVTALGL